MDKESDTHRASRMLMLWLDLREAMRAAETAQGGRARWLSQPWEHESAAVRAVWNQITAPENERALMQWLLEVGSGQDEAWAHQAIRECQRRKTGR